MTRLKIGDQVRVPTPTAPLVVEVLEIGTCAASGCHYSEIFRFAEPTTGADHWRHWHPGSHSHACEPEAQSGDAMWPHTGGANP